MKKNANNDFKVLHLVRSLGIGGMEKVILDLTKGLSERDVISHLGCLIDAGVWAGKSKVEGIWVGNLGKRKNITVLFDLCRYLKREKISLIHSHNSHPHMYGVAASLLTGIPLVHTKHGRNWPENPGWVLFSRCLSVFTKRIAAVSGDIKKIVIHIEKVPARKVETVLNGVDLSRFPARNCSMRPDGGFTIGSIGRFSPEKNYELLVRAFAGFLKKRPDSMLILVGNGPCGEQIRSVIKECGLPEDKYLLPGEQDDIRSWLDKMDVFCLSSDQEGTSITLLEAGAAGLASVVTDVGGNSEVVVDGDTGIVVSSGNCAALTSAFEKLAEDAGLRKKMGEHARKRIQDLYSVDRMVEQYVKIYKKALAVSGE